MIMPINNWTSLLLIAFAFAPFTAFVYHDRRGRYGKRIRTWRRRMTAMADQPFHLRLLTNTERSRLIGRGGLTTDEWARAWAADFIAGRRDHQPTCAEYLAGFGTRPKVRQA
jgi:hypothetical protein